MKIHSFCGQRRRRGSVAFTGAVGPRSARGSWWVVGPCLVTLLVAGVASAAFAQGADSARGPAGADSTVRGADTSTRPPGRAEAISVRARVDTGPPISPGKAFLRSFLVPGWGQRTLGRSRATAIFAVVELSSLLMVAETKQRLDFAKRHGEDSLFVGFGLPAPGETVPRLLFRTGPLVGFVRLRRQQLEDWITIVVFNHLLSGADAFVAAHLWDVPAALSVVPTPNGTVLAMHVAF